MKIAVIGEGMLELSRDAGSSELWRLAYAGDALNTAIHLARLGLDVAFISALGADDFSTDLRQAWAAEGLNVDHVLTDETRLPGLYAISTDSDGERSFSYWRSHSAARRMFDLPGLEAALHAAAGSDLLYFSLITVAVLPEGARDRLMQLSAEVRRRGGMVAFDSNYRPSLWESAAAARIACEAAIEQCDIGLPTLLDEQALGHGDDAGSIADLWHAHGTGEIVVKLGAEGCVVSTADGQRTQVGAKAAVQVVDTSGAGDAFNAGYLAARLSGVTPDNAAGKGAELAGWVIRQGGAIPAAGRDEPYSKIRGAIGR
jgi:2-dehydro-3-deoxygluconokinase